MSTLPNNIKATTIIDHLEKVITNAIPNRTPSDYIPSKYTTPQQWIYYNSTIKRTILHPDIITLTAHVIAELTQHQPFEIDLEYIKYIISGTLKRKAVDSHRQQLTHPVF